MKYILLIATLTLMGCEGSEESGKSIVDTNGNGELRKYEDKESGITCYQTSYHNLSCIKTKQSLKEEIEEAQLREIFKKDE